MHRYAIFMIPALVSLCSIVTYNDLDSCQLRAGIYSVFFFAIIDLRLIFALLFNIKAPWQ